MGDSYGAMVRGAKDKWLDVDRLGSSTVRAQSQDRLLVFEGLLPGHYQKRCLKLYDLWALSRSLCLQRS